DWNMRILAFIQGGSLSIIALIFFSFLLRLTELENKYKKPENVTENIPNVSAEVSVENKPVVSEEKKTTIDKLDEIQLLPAKESITDKVVTSTIESEQIVLPEKKEEVKEVPQDLKKKARPSSKKDDTRRIIHKIIKKK
ncbi:MAG TPA: hypothetical protein VMZ91_15915, partial [Candidatus Paceibacterota bacterium]|nr:hypothetical protein [Candidatus Paceibacterota bacterium]